MAFMLSLNSAQQLLSYHIYQNPALLFFYSKIVLDLALPSHCLYSASYTPVIPRQAHFVFLHCSVLLFWSSHTTMALFLAIRRRWRYYAWIDLWKHSDLRSL
jgi:hypothetical protein